MSKKLKNVKAVKEMIAGTHKSQTKTNVSFGETKEVIRREVGDQWTDDDGNIWEQRKGYKVKLGKLSKLRDELTKFPNCKKDICTCTNPKRNDIKMKTIHGMCFDCVIQMEHQHKLDGTFEEYEREKIHANMKSWLGKAEIEKEALKTALKARFVNEDGSIEEWNDMSWEQVEEKIDNEFRLFKNNYLKKWEDKK
jgi:hypothetical protein|tara:strand:- start:104 stop:688 length:585 start_codon:yes stop_codon:yes gene_type:complete